MRHHADIIELFSCPLADDEKVLQTLLRRVGGRPFQCCVEKCGERWDVIGNSLDLVESIVCNLYIILINI